MKLPESIDAALRACSAVEPTLSPLTEADLQELSRYAAAHRNEAASTVDVLLQAIATELAARAGSGELVRPISELFDEMPENCNDLNNGGKLAVRSCEHYTRQNNERLTVFWWCVLLKLVKRFALATGELAPLVALRDLLIRLVAQSYIPSSHQA